MKKILGVGIWVFLLASAALVSVAQAADVEKQIRPGSATVGGRYQLFQGIHTINNKGTPFSDSAVFKIDTQTGQVWKYREGMTPDGTHYSVWEPVK